MMVFGPGFAFIAFIMGALTQDEKKGTAFGNFIVQLFFWIVEPIGKLFVFLGPVIKFVLGFIAVAVILTFCGIGLPLRVQ